MTISNIPNHSIMSNLPSKPDLDRREVRIHCQINVQFRLGDLNDYGICWNLGLNGMYITFEGDVVQSELVELSFVISDEYPLLIEAIGRVVWINNGRMHLQKHTPEGFGVEFVSISNEARLAIQKFIELY
jgi:hypothetical protein